MSNSQRPYERLTRPRFGMNGSGALWLGKDHLLLVNNAFAVERYRRWYLREIQGLVIRRTSMRLVWNSILGVFAFMFFAAAGGCLFGSGTSTASDDVMVLAVMAAIFGVLGLAFVGAVALNTGMGPACTVFIQTPHGLDRLSTPNRVPGIEKLTARLQPLLLAAQAKGGKEQESLHDVAAALDQPNP